MLRSLRWLGLALIALIVGAVLLNCFDRKLKPEVEEYARSTAPAIPPERNAFYATLGFNAPAGTEPHLFGQQVTKRFEEFLRQSPRPQSFDAYEGVTRADLRDWEKPVCGQLDESCVDAVSERNADVRKALAANELLLRRYAALKDYPAYANTLTPHTQNPLGSANLVRTHELWLAGQALRARDGDVGEAVTALGDDLRFWRRMAVQPANLLEKVIAFAGIGRDVRLLSAFVRVFELDANQLGQMTNLLAPLSAEEKSLAGAFREEFRLMYFTLRDVDVVNDPTFAPEVFDILKRPLYQRNATSNSLYLIYQDYTRLAQMSPPDYLAQREPVLAQHQRDNEFRSWKSVYNPIGRILLSLTPPTSLPYPGRVHDLDGLMRLSRLQLEMRKAGVDTKSVPAFLKQAGSAYSDPYTGQDMNWDAEQRRLWFTGHGRVEGAKIWVQL